jgi:hypothetical protein
VERTGVHVGVRGDTRSHPHCDVSFDVRASGVSGLDVELLERAMWDALSDNGVLRIDADSWKELNDVAEAIARQYARLAQAAAITRCGEPAVGGACVLVQGHNMGRVDIPANHRA